MSPFTIAAAALLTGISAVGIAQSKDYKSVDLEDGFKRIETSQYSIEIPDAWDITPNTPWGQRKMTGPETKASMGAMTAQMGAMTARAAGEPDWDSLYRTSLYFIQRDAKIKMTPTEYEIGKSKQGYEAMSFSMLNEDGFAVQRFVILNAGKDVLLALNVDIPTPAQEKDLKPIFDRLVRTAKIK